MKTKLIELGLSKFYLPNGAFYIYIDISKLTKDSYSFCVDMVKI